MEVLLITDDKGYFLCHHRKKSLDLEVIIDEMKKSNIKASQITYSEVIKNIANIKNKIIIYTSIEFANEYKENIKDIMYILSKDNYLVPNYDILMAHENKSFQEMYKDYIGFESIKATPYLSFLTFRKDNNIKYPKILKFKSGSGSVGVHKVDNKYDVYKLVRKQCIDNIKLNLKKSKSLKYRIKVRGMNALISILPKKISFDLFDKYYKTIYTNDTSFVLQDFISKQDCDYKVLVYYDKIFSLRRGVRTNDFRASGSGKFSSIEIPEFAIKRVMEFYKKLDMPMASFDILILENDIKFIEWQGIHCGPATVELTKKYYDCKKNKYIDNDYSVEKIFAYAYINYIKENFNAK